MSALSAIALSGMRASQTRLEASAHNVANLATEGFHRQQVIQQSRGAGGVDAAVVRADAPGSALEADMVEQVQAGHAFLASLSIFRTHDRMLGRLLDATA